MSDTTPRFALPLLQAGQAQKEIDHNEALSLLDGALHPLVETVGEETPPSAPALGQAWVLGAVPTGAWAGSASKVAMWTGGGWRFLAPLEGMSVWNRAVGRPSRWDGSAWRDGELVASTLVIDGEQVVGARQPAITDPSGGTTIDAAARAAIASILGALRVHGLTA